MILLVEASSPDAVPVILSVSKPYPATADKHMTLRVHRLGDAKDGLPNLGEMLCCVMLDATQAAELKEAL